MNTLRLAWRNVQRNRRRSVLSGLAIVVATMSIVVLFSFLAGMKANMANNLINFYSGEVRLRHGDYGRHEHLTPLHLAVFDVDKLVQSAAGHPDIAAVAPRLSVPGGVFRDEDRRGLMVVGIDPEREDRFSSLSSYVDRGSYAALTQPAATARLIPAAIGSRLAERLGVGVGDRVTVVARTAQRGTNALTFEVAAILRLPVAMLNETMLYTNLTAAQRLAQMPDAASEVLFKLGNGADGAAAEQVVLNAVGGENGNGGPFEAQFWQGIRGMYQFMEIAEMMYMFIALFFFILASTVIVNTTMMVVFERRREIGTLSAMGMEAKQVIRLFFTEAAVIATMGGIMGLILGIVVVTILGQVGIDFSDAMQGMDMEISPIIYPMLSARSTILVFFFSLTVSVAAAFLPTTRIARMRPVDALRDE